MIRNPAFELFMQRVLRPVLTERQKEEERLVFQMLMSSSNSTAAYRTYKRFFGGKR
jgi:hypothetical protein